MTNKEPHVAAIMIPIKASAEKPPYKRRSVACSFSAVDGVVGDVIGVVGVVACFVMSEFVGDPVP